MKPDMPSQLLARPGAPKAVVIGAGFGGLAAAIRLACRGWRVQVLEQLDQAGGRAGVFRQDGYTFDAGPTLVTVPHLFEELWTLAGRRMADDVHLVPLDPFYRIRFDDGSCFDYNGDPEHMRAEVARISPGDVEGYDRFMAEAERCYRIGFEELGAVAFDSLGDLVSAFPALLRMRSWRTMHQLVASCFRHPKLRIVFSFHPLLIGGNPRSVTCTYSLINTLERRFGVHWPMGGTGRLVQGLVRLLGHLGVDLRLKAHVEGIVVEGGRARGVRLRGGERIDSDIVVSNGDVAWTYRNLVPAEHRRVWTDRKIDRARHSMSLFVWYFGIDRPYRELPHHMLVLGPRYDELLHDIFHRHHLARDFSLYLHRPTATDPSMAPPGCDAFYALSPVPHLASGTDWEAMAEPYRRAIEQRLETTVLPGLGARVVTSRVMTPLDFRDRLLSHQGAAFGLEPLLAQSAWFRPHNRSEDLPGLFLVGAGTHPGAGMPGVLMSAKALETVLPPVSAFAAQEGAR
ncbi:MAG: phytoene desaturase [Rubrivivax sp.]|nr:phytoene desaturase [Rubrivivax sp.]